MLPLAEIELLMACAPHLSFLVVIFSFSIFCIACPSGGSDCCVFVRLVGCVGCMLFRVACDCVCGNNVWAWSSASFIVLGAYLCMVRNSSCVRMALLVSFWICGKVVMPYVYSLSRNFWDFALSFSVRLTYMGLDFQANSSWVCLMGNVLFVVVMWISYIFLTKRAYGLWVILNKLVV